MPRLCEYVCFCGLLDILCSLLRGETHRGFIRFPEVCTQEGISPAFCAYCEAVWRSPLQGACGQHYRTLLTFEDRILQALCHLMALLLVARAGEAVPRPCQLSLQALQALLLLPSLSLSLLSHPFSHSEGDRRRCARMDTLHIASQYKAPCNNSVHNVILPQRAPCLP